MAGVGEDKQAAKESVEGDLQRLAEEAADGVHRGVQRGAGIHRAVNAGEVLVKRLLNFLCAVLGRCGSVSW